jgi:protein TonB
MLVMALHLWVALWLLKPIEVTIPAEPLIMEVSMVSTPGVKASVAPPAPPKPVEPIKPPEKKVVKRKTQEVHKVLKQAKPPKPQISDLFIPKPANTESFADAANSKNDASSHTSSTKSASGTQGNAEPYSEASFDANYGSNPKPVYPAIARRRGWEGKVLLKVDVSTEGLSHLVKLHQSSGYEELDDSAIAAVEKWQFNPAKRGGVFVPCTVIVPIIFTLNN